MNGDTNPPPLIGTDELAATSEDPAVRIVDVHLDPAVYDRGHLPGAVAWPALSTVMTPDFGHVLDPNRCSEMLAHSGIAPATTVICTSEHPGLGPWAYWYLKTMGHEAVRVLDGGVTKWAAEGRPISTDPVVVEPITREPGSGVVGLRADRDDVSAALDDANVKLLDVRTDAEFSGEIFLLEPPVAGERAGHLPGAVHVFFQQAHNPDLTFKPIEDLRSLYAAHGVLPDHKVITYCAVGMRSAHTWFLLSELLGYPDVTSYHRSWNEWGRLADSAIEV